MFSPAFRPVRRSRIRSPYRRQILGRCHGPNHARGKRPELRAAKDPMTSWIRRRPIAPPAGAVLRGSIAKTASLRRIVPLRRRWKAAHFICGVSLCPVQIGRRPAGISRVLIKLSDPRVPEPFLFRQVLRQLQEPEDLPALKIASPLRTKAFPVSKPHLHFAARRLYEGLNDFQRPVP